eukprot:CAMPEP_0195287978 /NCGR_PEP_ID=MMETSP0707-20130614/4819_1 /TAXON_ID=33640 /ORGANISM="Asterionellopsis glacialis, Strain CCMP134" /LENGTH=794 /DNA_ID=CAMNT_0040347787 /DNA_START=323 /DNA_END=2707 /DNA_ORIENTATION=+
MSHRNNNSNRNSSNNNDVDDDDSYEKEEWDDGKVMLGPTDSHDDDDDDDDKENFRSNHKDANRTSNNSTPNTNHSMDDSLISKQSSFVMDDDSNTHDGSDVDALLFQATSYTSAAAAAASRHAHLSSPQEQTVLSLLRSAGLPDDELDKRIKLHDGPNTHIQDLNLQGLLNLPYLPPSIETLGELQRLNLQSCQYLQEVPSQISKLQNLQELNLLFCSSLTHLPFDTRSTTATPKRPVPPHLEKLMLGITLDTTHHDDAQQQDNLKSFQSLVNDTCRIFLKQDGESSTTSTQIDPVDGLQLLQAMEGEQHSKWPFRQSRHNHWSERNGRWCYAEHDNDEGTDAAEQRFRDAQDREEDTPKCGSFLRKICSSMCGGCGTLSRQNRKTSNIVACTFCESTSIHIDYTNAKRYMSIHQIAKAVELYKVIVNKDRIATNCSDSMLQAFSCIDLGIIYLTNTPFKNENEAALLFKRASVVYDIPVGHYLYGKVLMLGIGGATPNIPLGIEFFNRAGTEGIGEAYFELAVMYETGHLLPPNVGRATDFYHAAGRTYKPNRSRKGWWKPHWDIVTKFQFTPTLSTPLEQTLGLGSSAGSGNNNSWFTLLAAQSFLVVAATILSTQYRPEHYAMLLLGVPAIGVLMAILSIVMSIEHYVRSKRYRGPILELLEAKRYAYQNILWEAQVRYTTTTPPPRSSGGGGRGGTFPANTISGNEDQNALVYGKVVSEEWSFRTRGVMNGLLRKMTKFVELWMILGIHCGFLGVWGFILGQEVFSYQDGCSDWLESRCQDPFGLPSFDE